MRFNDSALRQVAKQLKFEKEGRLAYRAPKESYRDRWFRLKGNLLFVCKTNDKGALGDPDPVAVLVMDRCRIQMEPMADRPFVFSVCFDGEGDRVHSFSGSSIQNCQEWVGALQSGSIEILRARLKELSSRVQRFRGKNPLDQMLVIPSKMSHDRTVRIKTDSKPIARPAPANTKPERPKISSRKTLPSGPRRSAPDPPTVGNSTFLIDLSPPDCPLEASAPILRPTSPAFNIDKFAHPPRNKSKSATLPSLHLTSQQGHNGNISSAHTETAAKPKDPALLSPSKLQEWETFD